MNKIIFGILAVLVSVTCLSDTEFAFAGVFETESFKRLSLGILALIIVFFNLLLVFSKVTKTAQAKSWDYEFSEPPYPYLSGEEQWTGPRDLT